MWLPVIDTYPEVTQWQRATQKPYVEWDIVGSEVHTTYTVEDYTDEEINAVLESGNEELELRAIKAVVAPMIADVADADIDDYAGLVEPFRVGEAVTAGMKRQFGGSVYKCLQPHTTALHWAPDIAVSLWVRARDTEVIEPWVQPESTNPYMIGNKVTFNGRIYGSKIDNNVWSPSAYPQGWNDLGPI
jgi:hypothetical protein